MSADIIGDKTRGNNMRVTNSMISNSASAHITNAKNSLLKYRDLLMIRQLPFVL